LGVAALVLAGSAIASDCFRIEAEHFDEVQAERKSFRGVEGVVFPKKESFIRTSLNLPKEAEAEVWARVYFPWGGQDAITLKLGERAFPVTAKTATGGGRWDVGNFQVWHWVKAGKAKVAAGKQELWLGPANGNEQRVDQVVLYSGSAPAWTQPWLAGIAAEGDLEWRRGESLVIPAADFQYADARFERLGKAKVAVLQKDEDKLQTVFRTRRAVRARLWARVFFEGKNMFEGLTMEEMAKNLYLGLDGELRKTVYQQNARTWHWVSTDEPCDLAPGPHLITLQKQGTPVKVDCIVLDASEKPAEQEWFRSAPPPVLAFGVGSGPERLRAGNWRAHFDRGVEKLESVGEREEAARFPTRIVFGQPATTVDLVRVVGLEADPPEADPAPAQQVSVWVKNPGEFLRVEVLYTDRSGEAFLQPLNDGSRWTGWRLLSAIIPLRVEGGGTHFDQTGYVAESAAVRPLEAEVRSAPKPEVRCEGGDRNGVPDFPLEVRALRLTKLEGISEAAFGEPFLESPFSLRILRGQGGAAFEVEVESRAATDRAAEVRYRFGEWAAEPADAETRLALLRCVELPVLANSKTRLALSTKSARPGIHFLEARVGWGEPLRRYFTIGKGWDERLPGIRAEWERKAGAFRLSPDGQDRPLKKPDGTPLGRNEAAALYGPKNGLVATDDGLDVCSLAYAQKRDFAYPLRPQGWDLSDEVGWPHVRVPNGVLAIDPALGRFKFAEANPQKLQLAAALPTGFGVPGPPITVRGNFAFVGPGEGHYSIVDISEKTRPRVVGNLNSWYFSHEMLLFRNFGYFESSKRGLILVDDLSNPLRPGPLRNVALSRGQHGRLKQIVESDALGYSVGGEPTALWVHDLSDPLYPRTVGKLDGVSDLLPCGFVYAGESIQLLDLSTPRKPKLLPGAITREKSDKGKLTTRLLTASPDDLALLTEKRVDLYHYSATAKGLEAEKLASFPVPEKSGNHLFGAFHRGLFYLIDGREGPGQYSLGAKSSASRWFVYELAGGKANLAGLYDHSCPSAFGNITIVGDTAYVSDYNYGMWVFDLADPKNPRRIGGAVTAGESDALWLDGDRAYQWQTFGGAVYLIDLSSPLSPKRLGEYWDGAWLPYGNSRRGNNTVAGKDGFLYIPRQDRGLLVVDQRDAASPRMVTEFRDEQGKSLQLSGACIDVRGDRAFVLARKRLLVYDVAEAARPRLLSGLDIPEADLLCAKGDKLYLGHAKGGFAVVDVSDASKPAVAATLDLAPFCTEKMSEAISGIAVAKGHAYLTARGAERKGANYLHVVDVRDPKQPRWVTTFDPRPDLPEAPCSVWADFDQDIIADGDYIFIGNYGAVECYDIREPASPRFFDRRHVGYQWSVGRKRGDYLFVPALSGLLVLRAPSSSQAPAGKLEAKAGF
jgi:hypothetical protein